MPWGSHDRTEFAIRALCEVYPANWSVWFFWNRTGSRGQARIAPANTNTTLFSKIQANGFKWKTERLWVWSSTYWIAREHWGVRLAILNSLWKVVGSHQRPILEGRPYSNALFLFLELDVLALWNGFYSSIILFINTMNARVIKCLCYFHAWAQFC